MQSEKALQEAVAAYLDHTGLLWCHVANERQTDVARGAALKRAGVKAGVPDILIFDAPGLAVELKSSEGRLSPAQRVWRDRLLACGWRWACCRSVAEVQAIVREVYGRG